MTLFTWRGTPVRLHASFLWLAGAWIVMRLFDGGLVAAGSAALMGIAVFGSVLLHEMGHAAMARAFEIRTRDITLYPFGGIASLEREPTRPLEEALVAFAGPAVNFAIAGVVLALLGLGLPGLGVLLAVNLGLGIFNLLPAFPMDGGRVLRAWWSVRHGRTVATLRALRVGRGFGWAFVALGLFGNAGLLLVGVFLLLVIRSERRRWTAAASYTDLTGREAPWVRPAGRTPGAWAHPPAG